MYCINRTFNQARVDRTYNKGDIEELDELTGSEIQYLIKQLFISSKVKKVSTKKRRAIKDD